MSSTIAWVRHIAWLATAVVFAIVAASCGSSDDVAGDSNTSAVTEAAPATTAPTNTAPTNTAPTNTQLETTEPEASTTIAEQSTAPPEICDPTEAVAVRPGALLELLRHVPNEDAYREAIRFNDVARFTNDAGLVLPSVGCDDEIQAYSQASFDGMGWFPGGPGGTPSERIQSEVDAWGFSYLEHSAVMLTGAPANPLRLRLVDVDEQRVTEAVSTDLDWADDVTIVGELFFDWGRSIDFERESPARPFGRGGALAMGDGIAVQADDVQIVTASLAAFAQEAGLDTDPHFNALAVDLETRGVHAAFLTDEVAFPTSFEVGEAYDPATVRNAIASFPFLPKPGAVALGWTYLGESGEFTIAMSAASPEEAQVMVDAIVARSQVEIPEINYSYVDRFTVAEASVVGDLAIVVMTAEQRVWLDRMVIGLFLAPTN